MGRTGKLNNVIKRFFLLVTFMTILHDDVNGQERNKDTTVSAEITRNPISPSLDNPTSIAESITGFTSSERPTNHGHFRTDEPTSSVDMKKQETLEDDSTVSSTYNSSSIFREANESDILYEDFNNTDYYYDYEYSDYPYSEIKEISFTKTLYFCEYIFSAMFGSYESFPDSGLVHNNVSVTVIHEEKFHNICRPFYSTYNNCSDRREITFCHDENVLFLNAHGCQRPSVDDIHFEHLLAATLLENDDECFQSVCSGNTRVIDQIVNGNHIRLIQPDEMNTNVKCQKYLHHYFLNNSLSAYAMKNTNWPCCYPTYTLLVPQDQQNKRVLNIWNYLPSKCYVSEVIVSVLTGIATTNSGVSNFVVIFVLLAKGWRSKDLKLLKLSLSISDFLLSIFVMFPAFIKHIMLMQVNQETKVISSEEDIIQYFEMEYSNQENMSEIRSGYYIFSAVIMSLCSLNSLYTLSALAYERFTSTSRICKNKNYFPQSRIKIFIGTSWMLSLLLAIGLMHDDQGISSEICSFAKLSIGVSKKGKKIVLPLVMVFSGLVNLFTIILLGLAIYNYRNLQKEKSEQQQTEEKNTHRVTVTIMTIAFIISVIFGGMATCIYVTGAKFQNSEVLSCISWWIFLFSTSWNPWLYNLSDHQFKSDVTQTFTAAIAAICWGRLWVPPEDNSSQSHHDDKDNANSTSHHDVNDSADSDSNKSFKRKSVSEEPSEAYREESV